MCSNRRGGRILATSLIAAALGVMDPAAVAAEGAGNTKIKSETRSFDARSIRVPETLARFEIAATGGQRITVSITGLTTLVDTVRFDVADGVLTIRDESTKQSYSIVSDRQNIVTGSDNIIVNNIGKEPGRANNNIVVSGADAELLPLTFKLSVPERLAVRFDKAMGQVTLTGLAGAHQINIADNGELSAHRLSGRLILHLSDNTSARIRQATLDDLSLTARENAEAEISGVAGQAAFSATDNAQIKYSGTARKARFTAAENGTINASGDIQAVTRTRSGNAEIRIR